MPEITNDEKEIIEQKLEYIGLDLENVPEFLKSFKPLNYRPLESYDDTYKIYKYINICDIQILITPTDRLTSLQEKYNEEKWFLWRIWRRNRKSIRRKSYRWPRLIMRSNCKFKDQNYWTINVRNKTIAWNKR